jgi:hypothetical protein
VRSRSTTGPLLKLCDSLLLPWQFFLLYRHTAAVPLTCNFC